MESQELRIFPRYNKSDWNKVFLSEIGNEAFDSMQFKIDGEVFSPYYTAEDIKQIGGALPKVNDQIHFGEYFDLTMGKMPLSAIKASLSHGYDAPVFIIDRTVNASSMDEIHMDYLQARFELKEFEAEQFVLDLESKYASSEWKADIVRHYKLTNVGGMNKMIFEFNTEHSVLDFISKFKEDLDKITDLDPNACILKVTLCGQFVKDIVKSRTIKIFWFNYLASKNLPMLPYFCEITWDLSGDYPNEVLFHTNNIISATMAQADTIILNLEGEHEDRKRILRNSIHIALIESELGVDADPVAGSYFIEFVANSLAEKAWQEDER